MKLVIIYWLQEVGPWGAHICSLMVWGSIVSKTLIRFELSLCISLMVWGSILSPDVVLLRLVHWIISMNHDFSKMSRLGNLWDSMILTFTHGFSDLLLTYYWFMNHHLCLCKKSWLFCCIIIYLSDGQLLYCSCWCVLMEV